MILPGSLGLRSLYQAVASRTNLLNLSVGGTTSTLANADDANTLPWPFDVGFASATGGLSKSSTVGGRFGAGNAYKFFTDKAQATGGLGCRSELWMFSDPSGATGQGYQNFERWVGFSLWIPSGWVFETNDFIYHILHQWHDNCFDFSGTETELKSSFEFGIWKNQWTFVNRSNLTLNGGITTEILPNTRTAMNIVNPTVVRGAWTDFVIHLKFKDGAASNPSAAQAVVQIWINGVLCADYNNLRMGYHHTQPPYLKIGNYSFMWNPENYADYTGFEQEPTKTHYADNIRLASASGNFNSVNPAVP